MGQSISIAAFSSLGPNAGEWIFWMLVVVLAVESVGLAARYL